MIQHLAARIGDFCKTGSGGTPSRSEMGRYYDGGDIPWVKSGELREGLITSTEEQITKVALKETSVKLVPKGAILLAMYGATVGRLAILGVEATTNQAVCHIVPDPKSADIRYLYHAISSQVPAIIGMGVGGAQPNISQGLIKDLRVPLPTISEQLRIATILDQADALRAKRREALSQLNGLTQAIFIEMFGDTEGNPKRWDIKVLSEIVADGDTINYGVVQPGDDLEEGVPLIRVGDLIDEKVRHDSLKRIDPAIEASYKRSRIWGDEILVSCVGSIGVIALASEREKGFNIARAVARIRLSGNANRVFIAAQLQTSGVQRYFTQELRTVSQPTLNIKQIAEAEVMFPPISLQEEFAARVDSLNFAKSAMQKSAEGLDSLFESIQHRAFRGEL